MCCLYGSSSTHTPTCIACSCTFFFFFFLMGLQGSGPEVVLPVFPSQSAPLVGPSPWQTNRGELEKLQDRLLIEREARTRPVHLVRRRHLPILRLFTSTSHGHVLPVRRAELRSPIALCPLRQSFRTNASCCFHSKEVQLDRGRCHQPQDCRDCRPDQQTDVA